MASTPCVSCWDPALSQVDTPQRAEDRGRRANEEAASDPLNAEVRALLKTARLRGRSGCLAGSGGRRSHRLRCCIDL